MIAFPEPPEGFYIDNRPEGPTLVLTGEWKPAATEVLESGRVDGLVLGPSAGLGESTLEFLRPWPLRRFVVIDRAVADLRPIHRLGPTLEELNVETDPRVYRDPRSHLELDQFPCLTKLSADWKQVRGTITDAARLSTLTLRRYSEEDLRPLIGSSRLTQVDLEHYPQVHSLEGAEELGRLTGLGVYYARKLTDISALARCREAGLRRLELQASSGFAQIGCISRLRALERLNLSDCRVIESVTPLRPLRRLRELWMWGSTRVLDDDLSPLLTLRGLVSLRMMNRRTYVPSVRDVKAHLGIEQ
jgi:hypothetical protein